MKNSITLSDIDKKYASRHGLSHDDMRYFILDMKLADELERRAIREAEASKAEMLATPQGCVYDAW